MFSYPGIPNPLMFPESAFITKWLLAKIEKLWTTRKMIHQAVNGLHMQFFSHVKNSKSFPQKIYKKESKFAIKLVVYVIRALKKIFEN